MLMSSSGMTVNVTYIHVCKLWLHAQGVGQITIQYYIELMIWREFLVCGTVPAEVIQK